MSITTNRQRNVKALVFAGAVLLGALVSACAANEVALTVSASAYNSLPGQGAGDDHALAAWGDRLKPGMKAIAVSRDLLDQGLEYMTPVTIDGLPGTWYVMDKMHWRWKKKIDIYMGEDRNAALQWGVRKVTIRYTPE